ncbi:E4 [human papillomavirus 168]|uniref:E4 n=1 Tax=human papillomavirus 168 TaxID=1420544 RepID=U6BRA7_9PAPI|nr:E4 [human papillomavirus 168]
MLMDFTLMNLMVTECILHCLRQLQIHMEIRESGLCIIDIQLLCPLPVPTGGPGTPKLTPTNQLPPGTPRPQRRNADDQSKRQTHLPPLPPAVRRPLVYELGDEEENKGNEPPYQSEDELSPLGDLLRRLLLKWEHDIDCLRDKVTDDFNDFKKKLGIRPY